MLGTKASMLAVAVLLASSPAAHAQPSPTPPIVVKPATLSGSGPFTVTVDNQTALSLTVRAALPGFAGALATPDTLPLPGGARRTVTVTLPPTPGTLLTGAELVLAVDPIASLPAGWVTRMPIDAGGARKPAEPAVAKWRAVSYAGLSWGRDTLRSETISLKNTGTCDDVTLDGNQRVGTLQAEGRSVTVRATCIRREGGGLAAQLSFSALGLNGADYTGAIDFVPADDKAGAVELTLRRTTGPINVVLMLATGLLIALGVIWWTATGRAATNDLLRVQALRWAIDPKNDKDAITQFKEIIDKGHLAGPMANWNLRAALTKELDVAGKDLRLIRRFGRSDVDRLKQAQTRLDAVQAAIGAWPPLANRLVELDRAKAGFESLEGFSADVRKFTLDRSSSAIAVGDVSEIRKKADRGIAVAGWWPEDRVAATEERLGELLRVEPGPAGFDQARQDAIGAWSGFDERRKSVLADPEIGEALRLLDEASALITAARAIKDLGAEAAAAVAKVGSVAAGAGPRRALHRDQPVEDPFQLSRRLRVERRLADAAVAIVLLIVALIAGAKALYVDKAVGGPWDYLEITAWAAGSAVVVPLLAAAIERYFRRPASDGAEPAP